MEPRKWHIQFSESHMLQIAEPVGYIKSFSFDKNSNGTVAKAATNTVELKKKRAMEIGMAPFKSLLQTGFMMWMSGNSINIFSIMITAMIVMNTTKSLLHMNNAFTSVNDGAIDLTQPKVVYMAGSLVGAAMGVYKCSNMGLLPTTSADWTWLMPIKQAMETSSFAYSLSQKR